MILNRDPAFCSNGVLRRLGYKNALHTNVAGTAILVGLNQSGLFYAGRNPTGCTKVIATLIHDSNINK